MACARVRAAIPLNTFLASLTDMWLDVRPMPLTASCVRIAPRTNYQKDFEKGKPACSSIHGSLPSDGLPVPCGVATTMPS